MTRNRLLYFQQKDFYRLQAFFNAVQAGPAVEVPYKDQALKARAEVEIAGALKRAEDRRGKYSTSSKTASHWNPLKARLDRRKESQTTAIGVWKSTIWQWIFTRGGTGEHAALLEDATRTGDSRRRLLSDRMTEPVAEMEKAYSVARSTRQSGSMPRR